MNSKKKDILRRFILRSALLILGWNILYFALIVDSDLDKSLTSNVVDWSIAGLNWCGFESYAKENVIYLNDVPSVLVSNSCNGLTLFALYAWFIVCFPGRLWPKVIFIPIGIAVLYFANVVL